MRNFIIIFMLGTLGLFAQPSGPKVRSEGVAIINADGSQASLLILNTNQTANWFEIDTQNKLVFCIPTNGIIPLTYLGVNSSSTNHTEAGSVTTVANGSITQSFSITYSAVPTVITAQRGSATSVTNNISVTQSNFVLTTSVPSQTNNWAAFGPP